jgi:RNA polymerase sigma factor (sigma-70 family)
MRRRIVERPATGQNGWVVRHWDVSMVRQEGLAITDHPRARHMDNLGAQPALAEFESIYRRHYLDVYRYVLVVSRSRDEAEEVSAEAFARALRSWSSSWPPPGKELPWLLLTARRVFIDRWRRARRVVRHVLTRAGTDDAHARTEFWLWFDSLSRVLSPRQREVLLLRYRRDLSDEDIGLVMGLSASGVRSLVARALDALRSTPELVE